MVLINTKYPDLSNDLIAECEADTQVSKATSKAAEQHSMHFRRLASDHLVDTNLPQLGWMFRASPVPVPTSADRAGPG